MLFMDSLGKIDAEPPKVSILDHGFLFGDSIYEVVRSYDRKLFGWAAHRERLLLSAERLGISVKDQIPLIEERTKKLFSALGEKDAVLRLIITRGVGKLHIDYRSCNSPSIFMMAWPFKEADVPASVRLMVPQVRRNSILALDPAIKSGNYLNNVMALREAVDAGFDDALFLNLDEKVCELTTSNVGWFMNGSLETPHEKTGILHGVTRRFLLEHWKTKKSEIVEADLERVEEFFVLSTLKEVLPVAEIRLTSGKSLNFSGFTKTLKLREEFRQKIQERLKSQGEFY